MCKSVGAQDLVYREVQTQVLNPSSYLTGAQLSLSSHPPTSACPGLTRGLVKWRGLRKGRALSRTRPACGTLLHARACVCVCVCVEYVIPRRTLGARAVGTEGAGTWSAGGGYRALVAFSLFPK